MAEKYFSGSCPQKNSSGQKVLVAIEQETPTVFVLKNSTFFASF